MPSKFYGVLEGSAKKNATRQGTKTTGIMSLVQDESSQVQVNLWWDEKARKTRVKITAGTSTMSDEDQEKHMLVDGYLENVIKMGRVIK